MRYLFVSHIFPPAIDGGSRVIYKMGQYFNRNKNKIIFISSNCFSSDDFVNPKSNKIISSTDKNTIYIPVYKFLKKPLKILSFLNTVKLFRKGPIFKLFPLINTFKKIKKYNPQVIICGPFPTTISYYVYLLKKFFLPLSKIIINSSFHTSDKDFYNPLLIKSLKAADIIWSLSQYETNFYINNLNIPKEKIITIGNGIDKSLLIKNNEKINYNSQNILYIGSFSKHKNLKTLINSFDKINKIYPNSTLTLAGQKTLYYNEISKIINNKNIKTIFNPSDKDIVDLIDKCQILVQASLQESFGLTLIEAAARKKPIITSNIETLSELNTRLNSGLIFSNNLEFKNCLIKLLSNPKLCQKLGNNGYNFVKNNYTWDIVGKKLESAILNL